MTEERNGGQHITWIHLLFFCSGFPALVYQIVWQRALFAIYGLNIQSVTIVVSGFMLGLGLGSLAGGSLSNSRRIEPVMLFAIAELLTGVFGVVSLKLFHRIAEFTVGKSLWETGLVGFLAIVLPTVLMGATLPLLVEHLVRSSQNVGFSVGSLYFANSLGSGFACFLAAAWLMRLLGQSGSVRLAALLNVLVASGALAYSSRWRQPKKADSHRASEVIVGDRGSLLPFSLALGCAAFSGFAALSYEIIWYRLLSFGLGDTAATFPALLGAYLFGLALGSRSIGRYSQSHRRENAVRTLSMVIFASAVVAFAVSPLSALALRFASSDSFPSGWPGYSVILLLVCAGASFFGATFPLVAHVSVNPAGQAGASLSYLYAANIVGSTLGTLVVGFILMDYFSLRQISILLLVGGACFAAAVFGVSGCPRVWLNRGPALGVIGTLFVIMAAGPIFPTLYDRLLFKNKYPALHFQEVIETRSGTIGVTRDGTVFGGGVYDGRFNIDLLRDVNVIVRPYALSALHPAPHDVLMIGLGSGSWAQVVADHPQVERLTVVEINPGYLELIPKQPTVASLPRNPKVHIVIDDGRRWLLWNPQAKFDAIVMNTTFHWRNHASYLLSVEFLQIVRQHLKPGGVLFYNTTGSDDVIATALAVYPYALRFINCVAVSDSPLVFDRARWRVVLLNYVIDGKHMIDASDPKQLQNLDEIVAIPEDPTGRMSNSVENNHQLRSRLQNRLIITDDNMGLEWR
ncbi:MAG: fused MFS/spermidine synthase [Acidobacteriia bacterium]|nr:fused MFS/spermidine synthase [Terriglobia bacterium]